MVIAFTWIFTNHQIDTIQHAFFCGISQQYLNVTFVEPRPIKYSVSCNDWRITFEYPRLLAYIILCQQQRILQNVDSPASLGTFEFHADLLRCGQKSKYLECLWCFIHEYTRRSGWWRVKLITTNWHNWYIYLLNLMSVFFTFWLWNVCSCVFAKFLRKKYKKKLGNKFMCGYHWNIQCIWTAAINPPNKSNNL